LDQARDYLQPGRDCRLAHSRQLPPVPAVSLNVAQDQARLYEGILDAGLVRQLIQRHPDGTLSIGRLQERDSVGQNCFDGVRSLHGDY
jgi:hypothetical protein